MRTYVRTYVMSAKAAVFRFKFLVPTRIFLCFKLLNAKYVVKVPNNIVLLLLLLKKPSRSFSFLVVAAKRSPTRHAFCCCCCFWHEIQIKVKTFKS